MTPGKTGKLRKRLSVLRTKGSLKSSEVESLARQLGRVRHKRGKEPIWVSALFPHLMPSSIPHHGGGRLNRFTARAILDRLEEDLEALEEVQDESGGPRW